MEETQEGKVDAHSHSYTEIEMLVPSPFKKLKPIPHLQIGPAYLHKFTSVATVSLIMNYLFLEILKYLALFFSFFLYILFLGKSE